MKPCKHCCSSGVYIAYVGHPTATTTATLHSPTELIACKYCNGKGWIDENELITVPRKYIKDEYFENK